MDTDLRLPFAPDEAALVLVGLRTPPTLGAVEEGMETYCPFDSCWWWWCS
jgi:hypothetical protein